MATLGAPYIEGIKEGREVFELWKRGKFDIRGLLIANIETTERLRAKMVRLANTAYEVEFLVGEIDFFKNQLCKFQ